MKNNYSKIISITLSLIMLISLFAGVNLNASAATWNGSVASSFAGGNGTSGNPYKISTGAQLALLRKYVNAGDKNYISANYKLTANIVLNDTSNWSSWSNSKAPVNKWTPIGDSTKGYFFRGVFDGAGYTVSGLYISAKDSRLIGLFSELQGATVKNLNISKSFVAGNCNVGAIAGLATYCWDSSYQNQIAFNITNCTNSGTVYGVNSSSNSSSVGGIVGYVYGCGYVNNCKNSGKVTGSYNVGGVIGEFYGMQKGSLQACSNSGEVTGDSLVGGVCAFVYPFEAKSAVSANRCSNSGSVKAKSYAGGVFAKIFACKSDMDVYGCYNTGAVNSDDFGAAGVIGRVSVDEANVKIRSSYNNGTINSPNASDVGGIITYINTDEARVYVSNCSNTASLTGKTSVAGIISNINSESDSYVSLKNCLNSGAINGTYSTNYSQALASGIVAHAYAYARSDEKTTGKIDVLNNANAGAVYPLGGAVVGKISTNSTDNIINVKNNRYLSGDVYTELTSGGVISATGNAKANSSNLRDEVYMNNLGFYICFWNFYPDSYPTVNTNGAHSYYVSKTTKATISANGKICKSCSVCGNETTSVIYYPKTFTLSTTSYTYDGKEKKPSVTIKDSKGNKIASSNYSLKYSNNKAVGKASVKITFKGNYSGSKTLSFTINPKGTTISSLTASSKGFTAKWKKQATQTTGYQIQYSTSSKFTNAKTVTVSKNSTTSTKVTKLTAKKKYYVRIRTYKTVSGTKYYSSWSGAKSVTTKK